MLVCSTKAKAAILKGGSSAHQYPTVNITVYPDDEDKRNTVTVQESDIVQGGMIIDRSCVSGNAMELGSTVASELTLKIDNTSGKFSGLSWAGAYVYPAIGMILDDGTTESIDLGVFMVDETSYSGKIITLTCLDRMTWFDKTVPSYSDDTVIDWTMAEFVKQICRECSVDYSANIDEYFPYRPNASYANFRYWLSDKSSNPSGNTYRNLLHQIGVITGVNWHMNQQGKLDYRRLPYVTETWATNYIRPSMRWSSTRETKPVIIQSAKYTYNGKEYVIKYKSGQTRLDLGTFTLLRSSNKVSVVQGYFNRLKNGMKIFTADASLTYYPFTASCVPMFWYMPMDQVRFVNENGKEYNSIITSCTYTVNGTMELQSVGEAAYKDGYATKYRWKGASDRDAEVGSYLTSSVYTNLSKIHSNLNGLHAGTISGEMMLWVESNFETTSASAVSTASEENAIMLADTTDDEITIDTEDTIEAADNDTEDEEEEEVIEVPAEGTSVWRVDEDGTVWCTSDWQGDIESSTWTSGVDAASDLYVKNLFAKTITASGEIKYQSDDGTAITVINSGGIATKSGNKDIYIQNGLVEANAVRASEFYGVGGKLVQLIHNSTTTTASVTSNSWNKVLTTDTLSPGYYTGSVCCTFAKSSAKSLRVGVTATSSSPTSSDFIQDGVANTLCTDCINLPVTFAITTARPMYIWARQTSGANLDVTVTYNLTYITQTPTIGEVAQG